MQRLIVARPQNPKEHATMPMTSLKLCVVMAAVAVTFACPVGAIAQQPPAAVTKPLPPETPVRNELAKIFEKLSEDLKAADGLVARLRSTAQKTPESARAEVNEAAKVLGDIADRLKPTGDVAGQLQALRNAATVHRKRVTDMAPNIIDEADRQSILNAWDAILQNADATTAAMADMKTKLTSALENLRMRQVAMSEMLLAGYHQGAVDALKKWLGDLEVTVGDLHKVLAPAKPTS